MLKNKKLLHITAALAFLICIALVLCSCFFDKTAKEDDIKNKLTNIIRNYEITCPKIEFDSIKDLEFKDVFNYFTFEGFFSPGKFTEPGMMEGDLLSEYYSDSDRKFYVPCDIVESLIKKRFNINPDRESIVEHGIGREGSSLSYYDAQRQCYVFYSRIIEFRYDIEISNISDMGNNIYEAEIKKFAYDKADYLPITKKYVIDISDNEPKFISMKKTDLDFSSDNIPESFFKEIASNYSVMCGGFPINGAVPFEDVFRYFKYSGCYDVNEGGIKAEILQYYDPSTVTFSIPCEIVDSLLTKRFITSADRDSIPDFNKEKNTYDFIGEPCENYYYTDIVDITKINDNTYVIYAMEKSLLDETGELVYFSKYEIEIDGTEYRYISADQIYDPNNE